MNLRNLIDVGGNGEWSEIENWPLVAIHATILPDGQILTFGTNESGMQGAQFIYDIWDPVTGVHTTLPNSTGTDAFCSNMALDPYLDLTLMVGGDNRINGEINQSVFDVTAFDFSTQTIFAAPEGDLNTARWYPGILTLGSGDIIAIAGREDRYAPGGTKGNDTIEIYRSGLGWDVLEGTQSDRMGSNKWYYPNVWQKSDGTVIMVEPNSHSGGAYIWEVGVAGEGGLTQIGNLGHPLANQNSSINHRTDKSLILDNTGQLLELDFSGQAPVVTVIAELGDGRSDSNMSLLADGRVLINGGATTYNDINTAHLTPILYDAEKGLVEIVEDEGLARLYHSTSTLTSMGTVVSAGGGAPGPLLNLNAQQWAPDYLFDGAGALAERMTVDALVQQIQPGNAIVLNTDGSEVTRVTAVRSGAVTHGTNMEGRFLELKFEEIAVGKIEVSTQANANIMVPGTWMVFVFDENGVPSVAEMIDVDPGAMTSPGNYTYETSTYELGTSNLNYAEAQAEASAAGGRLVQIDCADEAAFLQEAFGGGVKFHLRDTPAIGAGDVLTVIEHDAARNLVAQSGTTFVQTSTKTDWLRVDFDHAMEDAVIVVAPPTFNGSNPGAIRVQNVDETGFELQFEEWEYLDGWHKIESVQWMAVERGVHVLDDGAVIEAGISLVDHVATNVSFNGNFGPVGAVVLGQVGSHFGGDAAAHRVYKTSDKGFRVKLDEEEARGGHTKEDLHWIAFESGNHNAFSAFHEREVINAATDGSSLYAVDPSRASSEDVFLADLQSRKGGNTATLRLLSGAEETPTLKLEEEQSHDRELRHVMEDIAWVYADDLIFA